MKITINDVAREAGVAKSTVSRVLSNNPRISEGTRAKVNEVIKRLGYKPNVMARNLAKNQTKTIGVILPIDVATSFGNPIFIQMMLGISTYAQEKKYFLMYAFGKDEEETRNIQEFSTNGAVDGIIIIHSEQNDKIIKNLREANFPFVVIGRPGRETSVLW
ncbi:LacI family DNA-binding transcriptional regulator [Cellulosilyticum ruminicola]|uniref:LacI family DNA-binding transcriptional regulator n=1 Tax=Cellulosilyticum ruminicola TaxID=425254 RepID=UPI001FA77840|nr:LacI family DNA-binding transcriptional regulator [Cellulosilyticum ruminicola]